MITVKKIGGLDIEKRLKYLVEWEGRVLAGELGDIAKDHFLSGFPKSKGTAGGRKTDKSKQGWKKRKKNTNRALDDTGRLKRSIKVTKRRRRAIVGTKVKYASYVNKKREFIGESRALNLKSKRYIRRGLQDIFKGKARRPSYSKNKK